MNYRVWILAGLSGVGLFLSSWVVIPAPVFWLLPLGVGVPEISPLLLVINAVVLGSLLLQRQPSQLRYRAIASSTLALMLSSLPLVQLPATLHQAEAQMQQALGTDYSTQMVAEQHAQMRPHPVVFQQLLTGLPTAARRRDRSSFRTVDGTQLDLEISRPVSPTRSAQLHPAIITVYGGAWQRGEPEDNAPFHTYIAQQGYTVVAIDYRHAPQYRFPAQLQDVEAALTWVADHATEYDIDLNRIALMGWSAGAHLALLAAYQTTTLPIRAVISYYGPTHLTEGYREPPFPDPIRTREVLEAFLGGSPTQLPHQYELASPMYAVRAGLPPTLLIYGSRDHLVKPIFGQQLYERLQLTGNTAVLIRLPWAEHSFDAIFQGLGNQIALYYTERFLAWHLSASR